MSESNPPAPLPNHWRLLYDNTWIIPQELQGKDVKVTIDRLEKKEVVGEHGKSEKWVAYFVGKKKGLPLPRAICKVLEAKFGPNPNGWLKKEVTLYPTTCPAFGKTTECIRARL